MNTFLTLGEVLLCWAIYMGVGIFAACIVSRSIKLSAIAVSFVIIFWPLVSLVRGVNLIARSIKRAGRRKV